MNPEEKKLLEETHRLAEENNALLHKMNRSMRWARIMRIVYWVFIIGSAVGAFYLIQPYIDQMKSLYEGANALF